MGLMGPDWGPAPQLVLDQLIKMPGANCWVEGKSRDFWVPAGGQGKQEEKGRFRHALEREKGTSHVRS